MPRLLPAAMSAAGFFLGGNRGYVGCAFFTVLLFMFNLVLVVDGILWDFDSCGGGGGGGIGTGKYMSRLNRT
jgi:hypothetical protein